MNKQIFLYVLAIILILIILVLTFFPGFIYAFRDSGNSGNLDKCKPAPGYSEQEWREHMGHHPDIYKECFENERR